LVLALFALAPSGYWWFPLRLVLGVGAEALFVMTETWTNELSSAATRGRSMAVYSAALSLGMVCGPSVLSWIGTSANAYFVGAGIAARACVLIILPWVKVTPGPMARKPRAVSGSSRLRKPCATVPCCARRSRSSRP
jgi:MFS family permease